MADKRPLGEIARIEQGRYLPPDTMAECQGQLTPIPVWGANGVIGFTESSAYPIAVPLVTCRGNGCGLVQWTAGAAHISNNAMAIVPLTAQQSDPRYLYFSLLATEFADVTTGSAQPQITIGHLSKKEIFWTEDAGERAAIAHILGTLDDTIESNRRMNETLEAIAQARFQESFPCSPSDELPKGWSIAPFADTVEILGGGTPETAVAEYWGGNIPWFSVTDAPSDTDVFVVDTEKKITQVGVENSSTQILPVGTTIISARGTVGKVALVGAPMAMNQSCYGLRGKSDTRGYFTYCATRALVSTLQQHSHGSVFSTITRDTLAGVEVVVPPPPVIEAFEQAVAPMFECIHNNLLESRTLAVLRDTLLPKLISGELRLEDPTRFIGIDTA